MNIKLKIYILLGLFLQPFLCKSQYSISSIPNPKENGKEHYVSNPDNILMFNSVKELDRNSFVIDSISNAEYAIVIVNDYVGDSDFEFALSLFNHWGIGRKDADNGLLLFVAKDRREYRFISGYGMERIFPDGYLKRVGEKYLVPNFRVGNYDEGVIEASNFIATVLKSPDSVKELEALMPEAIPFWSFRNPYLMNTLHVLACFILLYVYVHFVSVFLLKKTSTKLKIFVPIFWGLGCMGLLMFFTLFIFAFMFNNLEDVYQLKNLPYFAMVLGAIILSMKIFDGRTKIIQGFKDEENIQNGLKKFVSFLFVPMLMTPLAWMDLCRALNRIRKNQGRFVPPDNNPDWIRINRDRKKSSASDYLNKGQVREEKLRSLRYEIWENSKTKEVKLVPWEIDSDFAKCPDCGFLTLELNRDRTLINATYSSEGKGESYDGCRNCSYELSHGTFVIQKREPSSSGEGSSSGGGSSGGGSSSGGSSFGGGSSGGGGAGGRW